MKDVIYVLGLKNNILSIYALDAKGIRVAFVDGQVLMWPRGKTLEDTTLIGYEDIILYKLKGQPEQSLVHESIEPSDLWKIRIAHVHYRELPIISKAVSVLLEIQTKHEGIFKGCAQGKNVKNVFSSSESKQK